MTRPTDPLYSSQWHLARIGNLETVWDHFTGRGVRVVVYDEGVQASHPDLDGNYSAAGAFTYGGVTYPSTPASNRGHGTAVAGLISAEAFNGTGGVGVAWGSTVAALNFLDAVQAAADPVILAALRNAATFDVMNNSWGFTPLFRPEQSLLDPSGQGAAIAGAFADVAATGRGGLGTLIVNAAGNSALNANGDGMLASRHVIAVAATDRYGNATDYSNWGSNILVSAPDAAVTTDLVGNGGYNTAGTLDGDPLADTNYTTVFGGTSAAAPLVSGVVALMLEANPALGWRDVHNILALSASHTGSGLGSGPAGQEIDGWHVARSGIWNGGGLAYSADYGFGMVDALAAVSMAEVWHLMNGPARTSANELSVTANWTGTIVIPDGGTALAQVTVGQAIEVETVMVTVDITHSYATDLTLILIAPDGSEFMLMRNDADPDLMDNGFAWAFSVEGARTLSSAGVWRLRVDDAAMFDQGTIRGFGVEISGGAPGGYRVHSFTDDFPLFRTVAPARASVMSAGTGDWLNFAAVSGNMALTLAPGQTIKVNGASWVTLQAGSAFTRLAAGSGNDTLRGAATNDVIHAGTGKDWLAGGDGTDSLQGGRGNDTIYGGAGYDTIRGGEGDDAAYGDNGRDLVFLDNGNDIFWDNAQADDHGHDTIWAGAGNDTVNGGGGNEVIQGEDGNDSLSGGIGNDTLYGGNNYDTLDGGDGDDRVWGGNGRDLIFLGNGNDVFWDNAQADANGHDTIWGGAGNDTVNGGGGNEVIWGEAGADSLLGGIGNDTIYGGDNYDTIRGGDGDDRVWGGNGRDLVYLSNGNDIFWDNGQNDVNGHDTIWGGAGNDTVNGGGGNEVIWGEAGDDSLLGGIGNDTLWGGAGADRFIFAAGCGSDLVTDFEGGIDGLMLDDVLWGGGLSVAQAIANHAATVGSDIVLDFGGGNMITLAGLAATGLAESDLVII
ncbi:S8 family serine peptidase [Albidovulum sp.]|uniref:S8 family serine peptidase n=1 Tax=Albidovulum sp. TaxID=1872424 RepID=UPI0039B86D18